MKGFPFSGIKVLDASQGVAGPHAGMLLAQGGADVIKLEPLEGDWSRPLAQAWEMFDCELSPVKLSIPTTVHYRPLKRLDISPGNAYRDR